jgi:hemerythrin HHE cation binding domain protein
MANKMKDFLPKIEMEKMQAMLELEEMYETGQLSLEEAREQMKTKVGKIRPYHLAFIEQNMKSREDDECIRADMRKIIELVEGFMDYSRPDVPEDHPLSHYYKENDEMRRLLLAVEDLIQYPMIKNQWLELYDQIRQYPIHYQRKQNQLYPLLEKKGFDRPTTTMWNFDDIIRDEIKESLRLLEANDEEAFIAAQSELIANARDLMEKEETILYPTSYALISAEEFEDMKAGDQEIGFAFFTVDTPSSPNTHHSTPKEGFAEDLQALLSKYGYSAGPQQELDVATGKLTLEQINLIYQHLPIDISFVDENELVKFYSDTDHRIFPRSKNVIGRQVSNCHPRKSVHIVEEIVAKFRSGEQDKAEFWINKPEVFLYIVYFAVRDKQGRFRGVLEMMQDCTHIRELTGSQTLLTWAGKEEENASTTTATDDENNDAPTAQPDKQIEITSDTRLKDLFEVYPHLKKELAARYPSFKMLNTPLGKLILKKATVRTAAERSGLGEERFIQLLKDCI